MPPRVYNPRAFAENLSADAPCPHPENIEPSVELQNRAPMIEIVPSGPLVDGPLPLGEVARFHLSRRYEDVELRWFLSFGKVFHTKPMCDWSTPEEILMLPESPGRYRLEVQWQRTNPPKTDAPTDAADEGEESGEEANKGWEIHEFEVLPPQSQRSRKAPRLAPTRAARNRKTQFWAPNAFEAGGIPHYESALLDALPRLVAPGSVVYDIGANIGLYSVPLSKAVGPEGKVYCFEPNPICVSYLHVNLDANHCDNCRIVPLAITDGANQVSLTLNFANSLVGISDRSGLYGLKAGQEIVTQGGPLEGIIDFFPIEVPDVIKIDVEGAEGAVARGMHRILRVNRPLVLIEIHGLQAAQEVTDVLRVYGYSYEDAEDGRYYANEQVLMRDYEGIRQMICRPGPG